MKLFLLYVLFAGLATGVNLGSQWLLSQSLGEQNSILLELIFGTFLGLMTKFLLDRRYIFRLKATTMKVYRSQFYFYSLTGLVTTLIFWGIEYSFVLLFTASWMRYVGGFIGLTFGYILKYQLDKRYFIAYANTHH